MKLFISLILSLFLYGCSVFNVEQADLYEIYTRQVMAAENSTTVANRKSFFTSEYLEKVDVADEKSLLLLNLSKYIDQEMSHYQKIDGRAGCLSVNGIDASEEPLSLHVEYKQEKGSWLVDYMFLHFMESSKDYVGEAICPRDVENMTMQ